MAGNTISVPVVGCLISVILSTTKLRAQTKLHHPKELKEVLTLPEAQWLGNGRASDQPATVYDIVYPKDSPDDCTEAKKRPAGAMSRSAKRPASAAAAATGAPPTRKVQRKMDHYLTPVSDSAWSASATALP